MSCVGRGSSGQKSERIKDLALRIIGIPFGELAHRRRTTIDAVAVRHRIVGVNVTQRFNKPPFAVGPAELPRPFYFFAPTGNALLRKRRWPKWMEISHGHAPMRDGAVGRFCDYVAKRF